MFCNFFLAKLSLGYTDRYVVHQATREALLWQNELWQWSTTLRDCSFGFRWLAILLGQEASLSCILLTVLEAEAYVTIIRLCNTLPTKNTVTRTPYEVFHKSKPNLQYTPLKPSPLGTHPRAEDKSIREEIGIFLSHRYNLRYIKFWNPTRHQVFSMRHIKPLKHQVTPPSWNYKQNVKSLYQDPKVPTTIHESLKLSPDPAGTNDTMK
jgi:hypothetical protein